MAVNADKITDPLSKAPARPKTDLDVLLARICAEYFGSEVGRLTIRWGIPEMILYNGRTAVPAASFYPKTQVIVVHEVLSHMRAPQYIYRYLIYHECLHAVVSSSKEEVHTEEFRKREIFAPSRKKSLTWLIKRHFPVMEE
jgi:predicted metal-dependent hydrolase